MERRLAFARSGAPPFMPPAPSMSTGEKLEFLMIYTGIFVCLAVVVQGVAKIRIRREKVKKHVQAADVQLHLGNNQEVAHGPRLELPDETVVAQFLKRSEEKPQSIALVATLEGQRWEISYEVLANRIKHLAGKLRSFGIQKGQKVVLTVDRGVHQVAAIYATMLCGAVWVPVDPAVPEQRLKEILSDCQPSLLLYQADETGSQLAMWAETQHVSSAILQSDGSDLKGANKSHMPSEFCGPTIEMGDCALIIYTSGTTGKPKGIEYSHAMLNHGANAVAELMEMNQDTIAFLKTPYIWAVVEWELFPALIRGATLVVGVATAHKEPQYMAEVIRAEQVTCLVVAPDVLDLLLDIHEAGSQLRGLKHCITVGSGLPVALANRFVKMRHLPAKLHNVYGASESSCTVYTVPPGGLDASIWTNRAPVGVPQPGCSVWVLDESLNSIVCGQTGEICFGGQLAMGYFHMPELTAKKFVDHPELGRIYRTGDLARWRAGVLEICGRQDRQVKIRGVRVEPEEVESALKAFRRTPSAGLQHGNNGDESSRASPLLDLEASANPSQASTLLQVGCVATSGNSPELVAFVAPTLSDDEVKLVKKHLEDTLPSYYIPKYIFAQEKLPVLENGKVKLQALAEEANKRVQDSGGAVVMDSLGRMRNLSKAAILENQVIHRCYAYWGVGVITDHWNMCGEVGPYCMVENLRGFVPPWVELFIRQVGNDQTMFGFIFLGALQDSRPPNGETSIRMRLGYADIFCLSVYLCMGFPIPQILHAIMGDTLINQQCSSNWAGSNCSGHRWYLFMIVWSHLCIAFCQLLRMPGWLQGIGHLGIALFSPTKWWDMCTGGTPLWFKWFCCWLFPYADPYRFEFKGGKPQSTFDPTCPIMYNWIQWYVVFYVLAFHYSRPGMKFVTNLVNRLGCNSATWAIAAWGAASVAGAAQAAFHYPNTILEDGIGGPGFRWWFVPLEFGVNMCQSLLLALAMAWFPFDLSWWGNTNLGTYCFHFYFFFFVVKHMPDVLKWMGPLQGLPQVIVLLLAPVAFMTTLGPMFHYLLLSPKLIAGRLWALRRRRL